MKYTREDIIELLAKESGYYKRDIRQLLHTLDDIVDNLMCEVADDDDVVIQLVRGSKLCAKVVPERERIDPRTQEPIICKPTVKEYVKWSADWRDKIQKNYENRKG